MADHSLPTPTSHYLEVLNELRARIDDIAKSLDPAEVSATNLPDFSRRWNSSTGRYEIKTGGLWVVDSGRRNFTEIGIPLADTYGVIHKKSDGSLSTDSKLKYNNGSLSVNSTNHRDALDVGGSVILDANNAKVHLKSGTGGTTGAINFGFGSDTQVYGSLKFPYDTRTTLGLNLDSASYPLTFSSTNKFVFNRGGTDIAWIGSSGMEIASGKYLYTDAVRSATGDAIVIMAGESPSVAQFTSTWEAVHLAGEQGVHIVSSPDNWASGWAGRHVAEICKSDGGTTLPGYLSIGSDFYLSNKALISNPSTNTGTNIDHFWHDDTDNAWYFVSDGSYKDKTVAKLSELAGKALYASSDLPDNSFLEVTTGHKLKIKQGQIPADPVAIGDYANLNSFTTPGDYYQGLNSNATNGQNYPVNLAGSLTVRKAAGSNGCTQTYRVYSRAEAYERAMYNNSWSAWKRVLNLNTGSSFGVGDYVMAQFIHPDPADGYSITSGGSTSGSNLRLVSFNTSTTASGLVMDVVTGSSLSGTWRLCGASVNDNYVAMWQRIL